MFDVGGDDYIIKFICFRVFFSCIKVLLRCFECWEEEWEELNIFFIGDFIIDWDWVIVIKGEEVIELAKKEFEFFFLFVFKLGKVFFREEIFNKVWGIDVIVGNCIIDVYIWKFWEKIGDYYIKIIKGIGYKFEF